MPRFIRRTGRAVAKRVVRKPRRVFKRKFRSRRRVVSGYVSGFNRVTVMICSNLEAQVRDSQVAVRAGSSMNEYVGASLEHPSVVAARARAREAAIDSVTYEFFPMTSSLANFACNQALRVSEVGQPRSSTLVAAALPFTKVTSIGRRVSLRFKVAATLRRNNKSFWVPVATLGTPAGVAEYFGPAHEFHHSADGVSGLPNGNVPVGLVRVKVIWAFKGVN